MTSVAAVKADSRPATDADQQDAQPADLAKLAEAGSRPEPAYVFLTATQVIARYGWGRTKGYRILRGEGFPRPIGGDRYRLDTLLAWEEAQLKQPHRPRPVPTLPPRKSVRAAAAQ